PFLHTLSSIYFNVVYHIDFLTCSDKSAECPVKKMKEFQFFTKGIFFSYFPGADQKKLRARANEII
uniref:Uncharacterized protein n=1 Tax=Sus scrofa TaxID=9823 RepID=A0A8D1FTG9_PIG